MNKIYKHLFGLIILVVLILSVIIPTMALGNNKDFTKTTVGEVFSKEEVVYGKLDPNGKTYGIYVINILDVISSGQITDYGNYKTIRNLTNLKDIEFNKNSISTYSEIGKFYYQGNLKNTELPWEIDIKYQLDGEYIAAQELVGESGKLKMDLVTRENDRINESFYKNYILQIAVTLDTDKCKNIRADEGVFANSGRDKIINFTVMPDTKGDFNLNTDVEDFEMKGISISAVPFSMNIDLPDTSDLEKDLTLLANAITSLSEGATELNKGMELLEEGTKALKKGSMQYKEGIEMLDQQSAALISASSQINEALASIGKLLGSDLDFSILDDLSLLPEDISEFIDDLNKAIKGIDDVLVAFEEAHTEIDKAIKDLPTSIAEEDIKELLREHPENETINQLVQSYRAGQVVKNTYTYVKDAFEAVSPMLEDTKLSLDELSQSLSKISNMIDDSLIGWDNGQSITELLAGAGSLANGYNEFHKGLQAYTDGVSKLASEYRNMDSGISSFSDGTGDLADGIRKLAKGLRELDTQTKGMPKMFKDKINELMGTYDTSDYKPISFVSDKNENVIAVQFVLTTDPIEEEKTPITIEVKEEEGFCYRLKKLFFP